MSTVVSTLTRMARVAIVAAIGVGSSLPVLANQEVAVGRVDVQLPGDGWQVYLMDENTRTIATSGHSHQQMTEFKLIARGGADRVLQTLLLVRTNRSGLGRFSGVMFGNAKCEGTEQVLAEGETTRAGARSLRCMHLSPPHSVADSQSIPPDVLEVLSREGWTLPPVMLYASAMQHASTGAFAVVIAYVQPTQEASEEDTARDVPEKLPPGVTPQTVRWGRQLQKAVSDSVYSVRGKLPVPDLERVGGIR